MRFIGKDPNIIDAYYTATAEGAITAGKPIIVEADGDVAQVGFDDASAGAESVLPPHLPRWELLHTILQMTK